MAERNSGWVSGGLVNAEDARLATGVLAGPSEATTVGASIQSRSGIKPANGKPGIVQATSPTASGSVTVQPFQGVIQGGRSAAAGPYLVTLDQVATINVLARPNNTAQTRSDLIVAVQTDREYGDERSALEIRHVPGTPAASPADPVVAEDHIKLARVTVAGGATTITASNIADLRTYTTAVGGVLPVADRGSRPSAPYQGQVAYTIAEGTTEVFDGSSWRPIGRGGVASYGPADANFPQAGPTSGATAFLINRLTVPAVGYPRSLHITSQVTFSSNSHSGGYDVDLKTDSIWTNPIPPRGGVIVAADTVPPPLASRTLSTIVVQALPNDPHFSGTLTAVLDQTANRARVIDTVISRKRGSGSMAWLLHPYTQTNVLAFPV